MIHNKDMEQRKGFTLIELLVVIAIIALLSSVVLATLAKARSKGRDAKRVADIEQLMTALELYNDANGHYPSSVTGCGAAYPNGFWCNSVESLDGAGHWIRDNGTPDVLSPYIAKDPIDPIPKAPVTNGWPTDPGIYYYNSATTTTFATTYIIVFTVENSPHPLESNGGATDCTGVNRNYGNGSNGIITVGPSCAK